MHMNDSGLWFAFYSAWGSLVSILYQLLKINWEILSFPMLHDSLNAIENIHNVISKPLVSKAWLLVDHHAVFFPPASQEFLEIVTQH